MERGKPLSSPVRRSTRADGRDGWHSRTIVHRARDRHCERLRPPHDNADGLSQVNPRRRRGPADLTSTINGGDRERIADPVLTLEDVLCD
jgi:hypothetical protein